MKKNNEPLRFSSYFEVDEQELDKYGAVNISLINDLPLFIDPFLLFGSEKKEYIAIHDQMVRYLLFLKREAISANAAKGMFNAWFTFPEVKQTWLGFSESGNKGRGLGMDFASGLYDGMNTIFRDFGDEPMLESPHMEKLSLLRPHIGRDKISDFTTNFAKEFLLEYTEAFANQYIKIEKLKEFNVSKVKFNFATKRWESRKFRLPCYKGDYVLLTPRDMLTKSDTFINRSDMIKNVSLYADSIGDSALRFQFELFIQQVFEDDELKQKQRETLISDYISKHPEIVNYYIQFKEYRKDQAKAKSEDEVADVLAYYDDASIRISSLLESRTNFFSVVPTSFIEAKKRVEYLKHAIEKQDVYKLLWINGEKPKKEVEIQLLFKLVWTGSSYDLNREANNGRGPVDYVVSKGSMDKSIVEFKLASNTHLKTNLANQIDIYKAANKTNYGITVIIFFTEKEQERVEDILNELGLQDNDQIVVINARKDDKPSASTATS